MALEQKIKSELFHQKRVVRWLKAQQALGTVLRYTATPKHFSPYFSQIAQNQSSGVTAGFPDLTIVLRHKLIFIEMKKETGGRISPEQQGWIADLKQVPGVEVAVCNGSEEAITFLKRHVPIPEQKTNQESDQAADDFNVWVTGTDSLR